MCLTGLTSGQETFFQDFELKNKKKKGKGRNEIKSLTLYLFNAILVCHNTDKYDK